MREGCYRVLAMPEPFGKRRLFLDVPAGTPLDRVVHDVVPERYRTAALVTVLEDRVPATMLARVRPKAGTYVAVVVRPGKGGGGLARIALVLAVVVAAAALGPVGASALGITTAAGFSAAAVGATSAIISGAITTVGMLAVNALFPPQAPRLAKGDNSGASRTYSIEGARNEARPYGVVPRIYGRRRVVPLYGARPYTELVGNDQYLRLLFVWGYGPLALSDLRIGETPLDQFADVQIEHRYGYEDDEPLTLYPGQVREEAVSVELAYLVANVRTSEPSADELGFELYFPEGLWQIDPSGDIRAAQVTVQFEISPAGAGTWTVLGVSDLVQNQRTPFRHGRSFTLPSRGQYDARVTMTGVSAGGEITYYTRTIWTVLRSITNSDPVLDIGVCKSALRIRATDQLNGVVDELSGIASSILLDWDAGEEEWVLRETARPASVARDVFQGRANARPLADGRVDLPSFEAWHDFNVAHDMEFDGVFDTEGSVWEAVRDVAAVGRATVGQVDGRWSVTWDRPGQQPVWLLTPRVYRNYRFTRRLPDRPHAIRVRFPNREKDWRQDERIVLADGWTEATASRFEVLDVAFVTNPVRIWRDTRYQMAQAELRPEDHTVETDWEHLRFVKGDVVELQADVILVGTGTGRIKARTVNTGLVTHLVLDNEVDLPAGPCAARVRRQDGTLETWALAQDLETGITSLELADFPSVDDAPEVGDVVAVGQVGTLTLECLVRRIEPLDDRGARVTLVEYAPEIHAAETGPTPAWESRITLPAGEIVPALESIVSDERVILVGADGSLRPQIALLFRPRAQQPIFAATAIRVQWREAGGATWLSTIAPPDATEIRIGGVEAGRAYEIRLRYDREGGLPGSWLGPITHTVVGTTGRPPDVALAAIEGTRLVWRYPAPPPDFQGFEVRWSEDTGAAPSTWLKAHDGFVTDTLFELDRLPRVASAIFGVWAVDRGGLRSINPATAILTGAVPSGRIAVSTTDHATLGWPGTLTGGEIDGATIVSDDTSVLIPNPAAVFIPHPGAVLIQAVYDTMYYRATYTVASDAVSGDTLALAVDCDGDCTLFYAQGTVTTNDPADYLPVSSRIPATADATITVLLVARGIVSHLTITHEAALVTDDLVDVAIASGGSRLPLTGAFRSIVTVLVQLRTGGTAVRVETIDKDAEDGPLVQGFDGSGTGVSCTVDAQIKGY